MTDRITWGSALLLCSPIVLAACGGTTITNGTVANAPPSNSGCTTTEESCNATVLQGVVAKAIFNADGSDLSIRFITMTGDEGDAGPVYRDGQLTEQYYWGGNPLVSDDGTELLYEFVNIDSLKIDIVKEDVENEQVIGISGIFGFQTDPSVVPTDGEATYLGGADVQTLNAGSGAGNSVLFVDFAGSTADLLAVFSEGDLENFTSMTALDMQIDGNTFTGDTVQFYNGEVLVDVTGANTSTASAGMFFGPVDGNGNPYEFGAVAIATGDDDLVVVRAYGEVVGGVD